MTANNQLNPLEMMLANHDRAKGRTKVIQPDAPDDVDELAAIISNADETRVNGFVKDEDESDKDSAYKKRYDDLKRHYDEDKERSKSEIEGLAKKYSTLEEELKNLKKAERLRDIPNNEAAIAAFKEKNGDLYDMMVSIFRRENLSTIEDFEEYSKKIEAQVKKAEDMTAWSEILEAHPDATKIKESKEFLEWYGKQTRGIQGLFASGASSLDIIEGLTLYKQKVGIKTDKDKKQNKRDAAQSIDTKLDLSEVPTDGKGKKYFYESQIKNDAFYEAHEAEIELAEREGRIILDITGKRRRG